MLNPIKQDGYLLYECQQGSAEWLECRAGVITASEFKKCRKQGLPDAKQSAYIRAILTGKSEKEAQALAGYKAAPKAECITKMLNGEPVGHFGDTTLDYAFQKAVERIAQVPLDENVQTWAMKRGHKLEPAARAAHEDVLLKKRAAGTALEDLLCLQAGFMTTEDGLFGCSADSLVGAHGGAEYKCLVAAKRLRKVTLGDGDPRFPTFTGQPDISDFIDQVQGCMWISGRQWWHFGLYVPKFAAASLEFQLIEVQRDEEFIDQLQADLLEVADIVDCYETLLRNKGAAQVEEYAEAIRQRLAVEASEEYGVDVEEILEAA